jgi:hypothetical protein
MSNQRRGAGFHEEALENRRVQGQLGGQDLDGGPPDDPFVLTEEDGPHRAAAEAQHESVVPDRLADHLADLGAPGLRAKLISEIPTSRSAVSVFFGQPVVMMPSASNGPHGRAAGAR